MFDFLPKMIGGSIEKTLDESNGANPIDSVMKNPMVKQMLKSYRKEIFAALEKGEADLIKMIESIELQPGETQAAPILDIDLNANGEKEIRLIVAAFENTTLTRVVSDTPLREFVTNWITQKLK